ncbi:hypothetical protein CRG98_010096 [Punica granatum]|uniref:Uncharacterized protein n=1 Tax=Punica granatum TaxID=22663 RepID=A0A2I0KM05_PUNGR|nr:hypothetical protein CRG98_010096 [Punica granatum]
MSVSVPVSQHRALLSVRSALLPTPPLALSASQLRKHRPFWQHLLRDRLGALSMLPLSLASSTFSQPRNAAPSPLSLFTEPGASELWRNFAVTRLFVGNGKRGG